MDEITQIFANSGNQELKRVKVKVDDSSVTLTGQVHRFYIKQLAQEIVRAAVTNLGKTLINKIEVT